MGFLRSAGSILLVLALAAGLRFPLLAERPMHGDEAVLAAKTGTLLEQGRYEYDPREFHGPTLHYFSLIAVRIQGAESYGDISETALRAVPAVFGLLLVAAHLFMAPVLGRRAAILAGLLAAISPAMVYYSRYYIHEVLLVFFSFGALISLCRCFRNGTMGWAMALGAFLGLIQATKETSVIVFASLLAAWLLTYVMETRHGEAGETLRMRGPHMLAAMLTAAAVSILLYSSFLTHPRGILDSFLAYRSYFERAASDSLHIHPWHFYLQMMGYFRLGDGPVWTEGLIPGLAIIGFAGCLCRKPGGDGDRNLVRFLGLYALLMLGCYAAIPYKTPWCLLGFLHAMILLAGVGAVRLVQFSRKPWLRSISVIAVAAAAAHLGWQAWRGSFQMYADPANPYVYAHTTPDVFEIARQAETLAAAHPDGLNMPIQIVSKENLWPLPWYLRRFSRVGWWRDLPDNIPNAPVILATPDMEPVLARKLYELPPPGQKELYMNIFDRPIELRPRVEIRGYAAKSLWDEYLRQLPGSPPQSEEKLGQNRP